MCSIGLNFEYSNVHRKSGFHLLFLLAKSSFGEHKLVRIVDWSDWTSFTMPMPFQQGSVRTLEHGSVRAL